MRTASPDRPLSNDSLAPTSFGSSLRTRVAGFYGTQALAEAMVRRALRLPGMKAGQVRMLGPNDAYRLGSDLVLSVRDARRQRGGLRRLMRTRGLMGLGTALVGLMVGLLAAVPPDQARWIEQVRSALKAGEWAVVLHPTDAHQATLSKDLLDSSRVPALRSAHVTAA